MNLTQYQSAALRTAGTTREYWHRLAVAGMGVAGEAGEVLSEIRKNPGMSEALFAEIGDCCWYLAEISSAVGIDMACIPLGVELRGWPITDMGDLLVIRACALCDYLKKIVRGTHVADTERVSLLIGCVLSAIEMIAKRIGTDLPAICEVNISKLEARYPNGFPNVKAPSV